MKMRMIHQAIGLIAAIGLSLAQAQTPETTPTRNQAIANIHSEIESSKLLSQMRLPRRVGFPLISASSFAPMAGGAQLPVVGGGTLGRLTKWTGFTSSNSAIGDSNIFEDKFGNVGIGTTTPTSLLTVEGMIETTLGGIKFPDGTVQTTAGLSSLIHDATLTGNGSSGSPLGVSVPLLLKSSASQPTLTVQNDGNGFAILALGLTQNGVAGFSNTADGTSGQTNGGAHSGVLGINTNSTGYGVFGRNTGNGNRGHLGGPSVGAYGFSANGNGVMGESSNGLAGNFVGNVMISSTLGIGVTPSGSKLAVAGLIHSTADGFKFPDGTVQSTAATGGLSTVSHNSTLAGDGTSGSPLRVANHLILSGSTGFLGGVIEATNTGTGDGVRGTGTGTGIGLHGFSDDGTAVEGESTNGGGVIGTSVNTIGIAGMSSSNDPTFAAVLGIGFHSAKAGSFSGDVVVTGNLVAANKNFRIDHPLDPENKYLNHTSIESSEMLNLYTGNVKLDANGEATVQLAEWFSALNHDFRYTLTAIGAPGPNLYIAEEVNDNHFRIAGGLPGAKVSWTVTGTRHDAWANAHRVKTEEEKSEKERGYYLHPELFRQPAERGIGWANHPDLMQRMREKLEQVKQKIQQ